jgi:hypothetical protein
MIFLPGGIDSSLALTTVFQFPSPPDRIRREFLRPLGDNAEE